MTPRDRLRLIGPLLYGDTAWVDRLSRALGVNRRTVQRWVSGDQMPQVAIWGRIADLARAHAVDLTDAAATIERDPPPPVRVRAGD